MLSIWVKQLIYSWENSKTCMGVIQCQLLWFFVTKPEVNFLTKNDYHCAKLVRNQYFIKKIKVPFLDSNYNESITEGTNQFSLKKFKVHCFDQKGQKSTVHFFASTKLHGRFQHFSFCIWREISFWETNRFKKKLVMSERPCQDFRDTKEEKNIT